MKTMTVREVASALGLTKRAVMYRLENGKLKGNRVTNPHGVEEWRVYPNKEVITALEAKGMLNEEDQSNQTNFEPDSKEWDDQGSVKYEKLKPEDAESAVDREGIEKALEQVVSTVVKPLTERIEEQAVLLVEKDKVIEEKERQLRLLPDLEKKAKEERNRAEKERKEAESKTLEAVALKKQIVALQSKIEKEIIPEAEKKLEEERQAKKVESEKVQGLEQLVSEKEREKEKEAKKLEELRKIQQEKDQEIQNQFKELSERLEKAETPWWKKVFSSGE